MASFALQVLLLVGLRLLLHSLDQPCLHGRGVIWLPAFIAHPFVCLQPGSMCEAAKLRCSAGEAEGVCTWMSGSRHRSRSLLAWQLVQMTSRRIQVLQGSCRAKLSVHSHR